MLRLNVGVLCQQLPPAVQMTVDWGALAGLRQPLFIEFADFHRKLTIGSFVVISLDALEGNTRLTSRRRRRTTRPGRPGTQRRACAAVNHLQQRLSFSVVWAPLQFLP